MFYTNCSLYFSLTIIMEWWLRNAYKSPWEHLSQIQRQQQPWIILLLELHSCLHLGQIHSAFFPLITVQTSLISDSLISPKNIVTAKYARGLFIAFQGLFQVVAPSSHYIKSHCITLVCTALVIEDKIGTISPPSSKLPLSRSKNRNKFLQGLSFQREKWQ